MVAQQNYAYLLRCADGSFYCGWTTDLPRRLAAHNAGLGAKYTRGRLPVKLVGSWRFETRSQAMKFEARIKRLSRSEKERLSGNGENSTAIALILQVDL